MDDTSSFSCRLHLARRFWNHTCQKKRRAFQARAKRSPHPGQACQPDPTRTPQIILGLELSSAGRAQKFLYLLGLSSLSPGTPSLSFTYAPLFVAILSGPQLSLCRTPFLQSTPPPDLLDLSLLVVVVSVNLTPQLDRRTLKPGFWGPLRLAAPSDASIWDLASALYCVALNGCFSLPVFTYPLSLLQTQAYHTPAAPMLKRKRIQQVSFDRVCISVAALTTSRLYLNWCLFSMSEVPMDYSPRLHLFT